MFQAWLPQFDFDIIEVCQGEFPNHVDQYDIYLATGSRFSVYDDITWIDQLKDFVKTIQSAKKIYIGVCFGHQMLAEALGGKVEKATVGWSVGVQSFSIQKEKAWMEPRQNPVNLLMMCQDQVKLLPPDGEILASTITCPVGMFQVGKRMLGIQAHPEFSKAYDQALMEARIEKIGLETVSEGLKSLKEPIHAPEIQKWVDKFIQKAYN